jgi:UDP-glucuronate 4-epimerase
MINSKMFANFKFSKVNLTDNEILSELFKNEKFDIVCHLAAQAGVRYSIDNPQVYIDSNILGFYNILENSRKYKLKHFIYASSSSVYGNSNSLILNENDFVDHPISLYAATKKCNELISHSYSHIYGIKTTGLRFFTVYGPWGRPDMAYFLFVKNILEGKPINVYANGEISRDFTYIDDIILGINQIINFDNKENYSIYNIGRGNPISVNEFVSEIELALGKKAIINFLPLQPGDVSMTYADTSKISNEFGFTPQINLKEGINNFTNWYKSYYKIY